MPHQSEEQQKVIESVPNLPDMSQMTQSQNFGLFTNETTETQQDVDKLWGSGAGNIYMSVEMQKENLWVLVYIYGVHFSSSSRKKI